MPVAFTKLINQQTIQILMDTTNNENGVRAVTGLFSEYAIQQFSNQTPGGAAVYVQYHTLHHARRDECASEQAFISTSLHSVLHFYLSATYVTHIPC